MAFPNGSSLLPTSLQQTLPPPKHKNTIQSQFKTKFFLWDLTWEIWSDDLQPLTLSTKLSSQTSPHLTHQFHQLVQFGIIVCIRSGSRIHPPLLPHLETL